MPGKKQVLSLLPAFGDNRKTVKWRQSTDDILNTVVKAHGLFLDDYDRIYYLFDTGDIYTTCSGLWNFCKYNLKYQPESGKDQTLASPGAILRDGVLVDCKHYSLFIGGVLDAIRYHEGDSWQWCYRFAAYNPKQDLEHVFIVVTTEKGKEIWIDPVLSSFDERKKPTFFKDEKRMLSIVSGIGGVNPEIDVDLKAAERDFLIAVNLNLYSIRDLLLDNMSVTYSQTRDWFLRNGLDFGQLQLILNAYRNG